MFKHTDEAQERGRVTDVGRHGVEGDTSVLIIGPRHVTKSLNVLVSLPDISVSTDPGCGFQGLSDPGPIPTS